MHKKTHPHTHTLSLIHAHTHTHIHVYTQEGGKMQDHPDETILPHLPTHPLCEEHCKAVYRKNVTSKIFENILF